MKTTNGVTWRPVSLRTSDAGARHVQDSSRRTLDVVERDASADVPSADSNVVRFVLKGVMGSPRGKQRPTEIECHRDKQAQTSEEEKFIRRAEDEELQEPFGTLWTSRALGPPQTGHCVTPGYQSPRNIDMNEERNETK